MPPSSIIRLGGMSDCFQPIEMRERVTLETIQLLNQFKIGYLIVTKSHTVANPEYLAVMDPELAHIQITVTCLDNIRARSYEKASSPDMRVAAILELQKRGYDVAIRLSPLLDEYLDLRQLNHLPIVKCIVEFLRVSTWIKRWFPDVDYSKYTLRQSNYHHLPLDAKRQLLRKIEIAQISVCEDVSAHYEYWKCSFNPNPKDCCNLRSNQRNIEQIIE